MNPLSDFRPDFWDDAACRGKPQEWWFPDIRKMFRLGRHEKVNEELEREAYRAGMYWCERCEVREECKEWARRNGETEGLWGGEVLDIRPWRQM